MRHKDRVNPSQLKATIVLTNSHYRSQVIRVCSPNEHGGSCAEWQAKRGKELSMLGQKHVADARYLAMGVGVCWALRIVALVTINSVVLAC